MFIFPKKNETKMQVEQRKYFLLFITDKDSPCSYVFSFIIKKIKDHIILQRKLVC